MTTPPIRNEITPENRAGVCKALKLHDAGVPPQKSGKPALENAMTNRIGSKTSAAYTASAFATSTGQTVLSSRSANSAKGSTAKRDEIAEQKMTVSHRSGRIWRCRLECHQGLRMRAMRE